MHSIPRTSIAFISFLVLKKQWCMKFAEFLQEKSFKTLKIPLCAFFLCFPAGYLARGSSGGGQEGRFLLSLSRIWFYCGFGFSLSRRGSTVNKQHITRRLYFRPTFHPNLQIQANVSLLLLLLRQVRSSRSISMVAFRVVLIF